MSDSSDVINDQLERIVALGYPDVADLTANAFRALARPLLKALEKTELGTDILLVPNRELVSPESLISRTSINRRAGFTTMPARDIVSFLPLNGLEPPGRAVLSGCRTAYGHMLYESRTRCGIPAFGNKLAFAADLGRRLGNRYSAPGMARSEKRLQSARLSQRGRARAQHLDEPVGSASGIHLAKQPPHLARQRILH